MSFEVNPPLSEKARAGAGSDTAPYYLPLVLAIGAAAGVEARRLGTAMLGAANDVVWPKGAATYPGKLVFEASLISCALSVSHCAVHGNAATALRSASIFFRQLADAVEAIEDLRP